MTQPEFLTQVNRLRDQWKAAYGEAKVGIIWQEFQRVPNDVFTKMIDFFLGEFRQPPVLSDFRGFLAKMREDFHSRQKQEFSNSSREFWSGRLHEGEIRDRMSVIKRRIAGACLDVEWFAFLKFLDGEVGTSCP